MLSKISQAKKVSVTWPDSYVESKEQEEVESTIVAIRRWDNEGDSRARLADGTLSNKGSCSFSLWVGMADANLLHISGSEGMNLNMLS